MMDRHRWKSGRGALKGLGSALLLFLSTAAAAEDGRDPAIAAAADGSSAWAIDRWSSYIAEASSRFGIPRAWIRRVMRAESAGRTTQDGRPITSRAGAMGLMQLMPGTWAEMRVAHRLGPDPHDPRDNILAGTAYLRAMYERFGYPGLFAGYNAGPSRYADHLATGRPLPAETVAYVAAVSGAPAPVAAAPRLAVSYPRELGLSGLFVPLVGDRRAFQQLAPSDAPSTILVPLATASSPSPCHVCGRSGELAARSGPARRKRHFADQFSDIAPAANADSASRPRTTRFPFSGPCRSVTTVH